MNDPIAIFPSPAPLNWGLPAPVHGGWDRAFWESLYSTCLPGIQRTCASLETLEVCVGRIAYDDYQSPAQISPPAGHALQRGPILEIVGLEIDPAHRGRGYARDALARLHRDVPDALMIARPTPRWIGFFAAVGWRFLDQEETTLAPDWVFYT